MKWTQPLKACEISYKNYARFRWFRENYFPRKLLENCQFAKFTKFKSRKNLKFWNRGNQDSG